MDGWDYGPGNIGDGTVSGGIDWTGVGGTLTDLAKVWGSVEIANKKANTLYAVGPNGRPYIEGQQVQAGGGNLLLLGLLVIGIVVVLKD